MADLTITTTGPVSAWWTDEFTEEFLGSFGAPGDDRPSLPGPTGHPMTACGPRS